MNGPFKEEYWNTACKEIETLEGVEAWEVVDQDASMNVIDSIWIIRLNWFPGMMIKKFNTHVCVRGDQPLKDIAFCENYAPVGQWTLVKMMLILEILINFKLKRLTRF